MRAILVPFFHEAGDKRALEAAISIARRFEAHVTTLFVQPDPADVITFAGEGVSVDAIKRLMESATAVLAEQKRAVRATFDDVCTSVAARSDAEVAPPSVTWREATGAQDTIVMREALLSDLVVFGSARSETEPALQATFEAVLLKARQPVLLLPEKAASPIGRNIGIAWNGTPEARSALSAAMPFLKDAVAIHLLTVATSRTEANAIEGAQDYLNRHDIGSERNVVDIKGESVGEALMREAIAVGADLLVMGGYGHSRLRERVLGGVTRHVIHQADLPVLLAH